MITALFFLCDQLYIHTELVAQWAVPLSSPNEALFLPHVVFFFIIFKRFNQSFEIQVLPSFTIYTELEEKLISFPSV